jgi:hypothetical protein
MMLMTPLLLLGAQQQLRMANSLQAQAALPAKLQQAARPARQQQRPAQPPLLTALQLGMMMLAVRPALQARLRLACRLPQRPRQAGAGAGGVVAGGARAGAARAAAGVGRPQQQARQVQARQQALLVLAVLLLLLLLAVGMMRAGALVTGQRASHQPVQLRRQWQH